jgi:peptidoglycan/LPS O-acetylase OafA/YrhL
MSGMDWPEIFGYAAWATVLAVVFSLLIGLVAHRLVARRYRKRLSALPFIYEDPWRTYGRSWWARFKAWWRNG